MSASPVFTVHRHRLDAEADLEQSLGLKEGQRLFVVSASEGDILLRRSADAAASPTEGKPDWQTAWEAFHAEYKPSAVWTPQRQEAAAEQRNAAREHLERVYTDPSSGATEFKVAERQFERALDDLTGGTDSGR